MVDFDEDVIMSHVITDLPRNSCKSTPFARVICLYVTRVLSHAMINKAGK